MDTQVKGMPSIPADSQTDLSVSTAGGPGTNPEKTCYSLPPTQSPSDCLWGNRLPAELPFDWLNSKPFISNGPVC